MKLYVGKFDIHSNHDIINRRYRKLLKVVISNYMEQLFEQGNIILDKSQKLKVMILERPYAKTIIDFSISNNKLFDDYRTELKHSGLFNRYGDLEMEIRGVQYDDPYENSTLSTLKDLYVKLARSIDSNNSTINNNYNKLIEDYSGVRNGILSNTALEKEDIKGYRYFFVHDGIIYLLLLSGLSGLSYKFYNDAYVSMFDKPGGIAAYAFVQCALIVLPLSTMQDGLSSYFDECKAYYKRTHISDFDNKFNRQKLEDMEGFVRHYKYSKDADDKYHPSSFKVLKLKL